MRQGVAVELGELELAGGCGDNCFERVLGVLGKPLTLAMEKMAMVSPNTVR